MLNSLDPLDIGLGIKQVFPGLCGSKMGMLHSCGQYQSLSQIVCVAYSSMDFTQTIPSICIVY